MGGVGRGGEGVEDRGMGVGVECLKRWICSSNHFFILLRETREAYLRYAPTLGKGQRPMLIPKVWAGGPYLRYVVP